MLSSNMHNQNVRVPFPPFWKVRFTVQGKHPSLPCADPAVQGQPQDNAKATTWKDLQFAGVAFCHSFHSKSNVPKWQQGSISKAALPALPRVRSWTSVFLETERCHILWLLQYKQAASWAKRIKTTKFLPDLSLAFCLLLPLRVLTEVTLALLFYFHPTGDSTSPS